MEIKQDRCKKCCELIAPGEMTHVTSNPRAIWHWECFQQAVREYQQQQLQLQLQLQVA